MAEERFSDLGRVEAIAKLYEGTPFKPFESINFETSGKGYVTSHSRTFIEGIDFDLIYFPLKHLGYKCVTAVTGELYAEFASPRVLDIRIGISAKLDFAQIKEVWEGAVRAAIEHGYKKVGLDIEAGTFVPNKKIAHTHEGSIGNLCNDRIEELMESILAGFGFEKAEKAEKALLGR